MALEAGTYISDLDTANPTSTDPVAQADDHIRLIKSVLKNTFPNATGAADFIGIGQTWQNVAASRVINTNYTNSTSKPICVAVSVAGTTPSSTVAIAFTVGGVANINSNSVVAGTSPSNTTLSSTVIVPPGATYKANVTQGSLSSWVELR